MFCLIKDCSLFFSKVPAAIMINPNTKIIFPSIDPITEAFTSSSIPADIATIDCYD
jgi:hypothetical protein